MASDITHTIVSLKSCMNSNPDVWYLINAVCSIEVEPRSLLFM